MSSTDPQLEIIAPEHEPDPPEAREGGVSESLIVGGITILIVGLLPLIAVLGLALQLVFVTVAPILVVVGLSYALLTRAEPTLELVHGIVIPTGLAFHRAHTWARRAAKRCIAVGIDDLARRLIGRVDGVEVVDLGTPVTRGQVVGVLKNGLRELPIVSPVDGFVTKLNPMLARDPSAVTASPYGKGWLFEVTPEAKPLRGLLRGESSIRWMSRDVDRLVSMLSPAPALVSLADGASVAEDIGAGLDDRTWEVVVGELVLSEG